MGSPRQGDELTAREVADALGVTERTVLNYVGRGLLNAITRTVGLSRRHTFTRESVEELRAKIGREGSEE